MAEIARNRLRRSIAEEEEGAAVLASLSQRDFGAGAGEPDTG